MRKIFHVRTTCTCYSHNFIAGTYTITIGNVAGSSQVAVDNPEFSHGFINYAPKHVLQNAKQVTIEVLSLRQRTDLRSLLGENVNLLVDFDLTYFFAINPNSDWIMRQLDQGIDPNQLETLLPILDPRSYCFQGNQEPDYSNIAHAIKSLNSTALQSVSDQQFLALASDLMMHWCRGEKAARRYFLSLKHLITDPVDPPNMSLIDFLYTLKMYPHETTNTKKQLNALKTSASALLKGMYNVVGAKPTLITVSRSLDIVPDEAWPDHEEAVYSILVEVYSVSPSPPRTKQPPAPRSKPAVVQQQQQPKPTKRVPSSPPRRKPSMNHKPRRPRVIEHDMYMNEDMPPHDVSPPAMDDEFDAYEMNVPQMRNRPPVPKMRKKRLHPEEQLEEQQQSQAKPVESPPPSPISTEEKVQEQTSQQQVPTTQEQTRDSAQQPTTPVEQQQPEVVEKRKLNEQPVIADQTADKSEEPASSTATTAPATERSNGTSTEQVQQEEQPLTKAPKQVKRPAAAKKRMAQPPPPMMDKEQDLFFDQSYDNEELVSPPKRKYRPQPPILRNKPRTRPPVVQPSRKQVPPPSTMYYDEEDDFDQLDDDFQPPKHRVVPPLKQQQQQRKPNVRPPPLPSPPPIHRTPMPPPRQQVPPQKRVPTLPRQPEKRRAVPDEYRYQQPPVRRQAAPPRQQRRVQRRQPSEDFENEYYR